MGYIAGFRIYFKSYFALGIQVDTSRIGASHNSFIDVLADAGWPALAIYLCMLFLIVLYGWSSANMRPLGKMSAIDPFQHVIRCSLLLLFSFFINGMDTSDFSVPLRTSFYLQFIVISMILVYSANIRRKMRADLFMYRELSGLTLSHSETL
jgi:O-antigen ligase